MRTSLRGVAEIVGHEGVVLSPYRDSVGVWTVYVGHTAAAGPPDPATMPKGVAAPMAEAMRVFRRDLADVEERVGRAVKVPLRQHEFDALVSFDFNTGGIFRARLTTLLNAGDRAGAAAAFDAWRKPPEIVPRRDREKRLFRDGVYAHGGTATAFVADERGVVAWGRGTRLDVLALLGADAGEAAPATQVPRPDDPGAPAPAASEDKRGWAAIVAAAISGLLALLGLTARGRS